MNKEVLIKIVEDYLSNFGVNTDEDYMSKTMSKDLGLDEVDFIDLVFEIESKIDVFSDESLEINFDNREQLEKIANSTVEEFVSFVLSKIN